MSRKEEFYFDSRDGEHRLHAVKWIPEAQKPVCVVQIIHGMTEYVDRYDEFADYLAKRDILVVGDDHLGHGKSVREGETYGYFCREDAATVLVRDEHRLKKMTQEQYAGVPYIILGHSMGSFILRNYLTRYGSGIDGAVIMGTGMLSKPMLYAGTALAMIQGAVFGDTHPCRLIEKASFGAYDKPIRAKGEPGNWLSRNEECIRKYADDPLCTFTFTANGYKALFRLIYNLYDTERLKKMPKKLPVLFVSGEEDPVGNYGRDVRKVFRSFQDIGMERVQMKLYPRDRHEILNELDREEVYGDIYRWILGRI